MLNILFALVGLLAGVVINILADELPARRAHRKRPLRLQCEECGYQYSLAARSALGRLLSGRRNCPGCGRREPLRPLLVEGGTMLLFALLPSLIPNLTNLIVNSFYIAVLILVIVIDLEHKLILNVVTFPATGLALLGSFLVTREQNTFWLALVGAVVGFLLFYAAYWLGQLMFGPGALGYGDVKLAMAMGAMLGFHRILFALVLAVLLGGLISLLLLLSRRFGRNSYLPYGQYLAIAGIIMLIWGAEVAEWYLRGS